MSKFFMNDRKSLINDVIEGVILTSPYKNLAKLDVDPAIRVVVRRDWDKKSRPDFRRWLRSRTGTRRFCR